MWIRLITFATSLAIAASAFAQAIRPDADLPRVLLLMLTGDLDRGSPADGIEVLEREIKGTYAALGAADRFRNIVYPDTAHVYTPQMRAEMLAWFDRWLKAPVNGAKGN